MSFERRHHIGVLEIAVGVTIGVLAANTIETLAIATYAKVQMELAVQRLKDDQQQEQARQQREANAASDRRRQREAQAQANLERQRQAEQSAKAAELKKDQAWRQFYKQPAECSDMTNNDAFVKCSNDYIRARRRFEETYQP